MNNLLRLNETQQKFIPKFEIYTILNCIIFSRHYTYDDAFNPYMHVFVHHVPFFIKKYGSLNAFEMQEIEHLNYVNKLVYFKSTNRGKGSHQITDQVEMSKSHHSPHSIFKISKLFCYSGLLVPCTYAMFNPCAELFRKLIFLKM